MTPSVFSSETLHHGITITMVIMIILITCQNSKPLNFLAGVQPQPEPAATNLSEFSNRVFSSQNVPLCRGTFKVASRKRKKKGKEEGSRRLDVLVKNQLSTPRHRNKAVPSAVVYQRFKIPITRAT